MEDGIDIWNSYADAFASTANYLTSLDKNPWYNDSTWGREVLPPKNISSNILNLLNKLILKDVVQLKEDQFQNLYQNGQT